MFDVFWAENSTLREKLLEHVFLSELSKTLLLQMRVPLEVLHAEFDAHGYDVVVEAAGVARHVQLKATRNGGRRSSVDISRALAAKPGGCVVWFGVDEASLTIGPFWWLGGAPGHPLPALEGRPARHSRANAAGSKADRGGLVEVPRRAFEKTTTMIELASKMFGVMDHSGQLRQHLAKRGHNLSELTLDPHATWDQTVEFGHLVDGYELCGLPPERALEVLELAERRAERERRWGGSALELWALLFLSHRRARFSAGAPGASDIRVPVNPILDLLVRELAAAIDRDCYAGHAGH